MHAHCTHAARTLRAHAIHVQVLLKLAETKATITEGDEAGVSLLHYAAKCAVAKWPDVRKRFEAEMLPLSDVSNVKSALVVADIQVPRQRAGHLQPCQAGPATPPSRPCNPAEPCSLPSQPRNLAKPALQAYVSRCSRASWARWSASTHSTKRRAAAVTASSR